jgi:peptidoglycan/LPS O-acetylase OafA/YrhL
MTLSQRLAATQGRPAGFDYLRILLAASIVGWHSIVVCYGGVAQHDAGFGVFRPLWAMLLPMFFALSGFLVSGSLERARTMVGFMGLRIIRLVPALAVESAIAMLLLGPLFTKLSLGAYLSTSQTYKYLANIVGHIQYKLPGVFDGNPMPSIVNAQLWTLPYELYCYIVLGVIAVTGAYRIKALLVGALVIAQVDVVHLLLTSPRYDDMFISGPVLLLCFLYGCALYRFRDNLPWNGLLALLSALAGIALLGFKLGTAFAAAPVAYVTVYLGLLSPRRHPLVSSGDYSYGIFLYGYPLQQAMAAALPFSRVWYLNLLLAGPCIAVVAWLSWHLVEKRALHLRGLLKRLEARWIPLNASIAQACAQMVPQQLRTRWAPRRSG